MKLSILKRSVIVFLIAGAVIFAITRYKNMVSDNSAAASGGYEPMESVTVAIAKEKTHRKEMMAIGTVVALRSISLRNELSGTVEKIGFELGQIVEKDAILVALDVSVEQAELSAQKARAALAKTTLERSKRALESRAISEIEFERAQSEFDITLAEVARTQAIIDRKIMRSPFRAQVGITDIHVGQYLQEGTLITTLQGVSDSIYIDFSVSQQVAATLRVDDIVQVIAGEGEDLVSASIVAIDAQVNSSTRHTTVRATLDGILRMPTPGASVRVRVPVGESLSVVAVPATALRKGPSGDHVFVIVPDEQGNNRAHMRRVRSGGVIGGDVLVFSGLAAGEKVASSGSFKLRDGSLVGPTE